MNFLIDTNVISEPRRPQPNPNVIAWFKKADSAAVYISALTLGELVRGTAKAMVRDTAAGLRLQHWVESVEAEYGTRVIGVDREIAVRWGQITAGRTLPVVDSLLAATALVHGMTLVTRNLRDIGSTGVAILNPWET